MTTKIFSAICGCGAYASHNATPSLRVVCRFVRCGHIVIVIIIVVVVIIAQVKGYVDKALEEEEAEKAAAEAAKAAGGAIDAEVVGETGGLPLGLDSLCSSALLKSI